MRDMHKILLPLVAEQKYDVIFCAGTS